MSRIDITPGASIPLPSVWDESRVGNVRLLPNVEGQTLAAIITSHDGLVWSVDAVLDQRNAIRWHMVWCVFPSETRRRACEEAARKLEDVPARSGTFAEAQPEPAADVLHAAGKLRVEYDGIQQAPLHRGPQWQFTDRKPGSTTQGATFYVSAQAPDGLQAFLWSWVTLKERHAADEARRMAAEDARLEAEAIWESRHADIEYDRNR